MSLLKTYIFSILFFLLSCSSETESNFQDTSSGSTIEIGFGSILLFEETNELNKVKEDIERIAKETISLVNEKMSIDNLEIKVNSSTTNVIPEIGIGGFNPNGNEVLIYIDPDFSDLEQSIATELAPMLAHEMHHAKRQRTIGYGATLLEAVVSEGLADCFSIEVMGIDPPMWSVALTGNELDNWVDKASDVWTNNTYDHGNWFFGNNPDIPRWTGYSIGFKLVKEYISGSPEQNASNLFDEPASSFVQ